MDNHRLGVGEAREKGVKIACLFIHKLQTFSISLLIIVDASVRSD
jgi:hypothetical protein